jgi:uncharacterized ParB-like nuclease family protein
VFASTDQEIRDTNSKVSPAAAGSSRQSSSGSALNSRQSSNQTLPVVSKPVSRHPSVSDKDPNHPEKSMSPPTRDQSKPRKSVQVDIPDIGSLEPVNMAAVSYDGKTLFYTMRPMGFGQPEDEGLQHVFSC